jgi:hydroquinone glucosyltransferase
MSLKKRPFDFPHLQRLNPASMQMQEIPHVAILPTPGMGHLIPIVELAKRLASHHNFLVTLLIPTDGSPIKPQKAVLEALPNSISSIFLPPVSLDDLPVDVAIETRISLTLTRSLPALRDSLKVLTESTRLVVLVVDLFGTDAFDVAKEFGVPSYLFYSTTAMDLSLVFYLPELDETYSCEYRDLPELVKLPGCVPIHGTDLEDPIQDRKSEAYKGMLQMAKKYPLAAGIMVNSFLDLEPGCFKALTEGKEGRPPVYPVGPLVQSSSDHGVYDSECLRWLDKQPNNSVLFVSFGSGGTLSREQLHELASGLEMSGQRFLWIVRSPHEKAANANYFSVQSIKDPSPFLPEGFLERTEGVGLVVPSWAPQVQILKHASTGGFLTHCGWNSILESIVHGVPLIAWPLYAEQKMNSVLLADDLKVASRVKVNGNGLVGHKDIANHARVVIEGEEGKLLRSKMKEVKNAAERALSEDGSSTKSLAEVAQIWKSTTHKD